ncbi:conserved hypothetical protein [Planktothrix sp. PCC 11201]|uniref:transposase n=1 Tax=Planktothrix sp. PCC 11201 TaxID=1729650 RepID=UPI00091188AD|nr:transposase [Planktothrix sp. PCC 11201]SKB14936.1 conserved hypothetical protein [Planktothrix sp. PCC 11201]
MKFDPRIHNRQSIRLRGYDYSQAGAYFLTTCAQDRKCVFGTIENGVMIANEFGDIVYEYWQKIPEHFPNIEIDLAVVMPNHFHGILVIGDRYFDNDDSRDGGKTPPLRKPILGQIVGYFKYQTTKSINKIRNQMGVKIWQRNYYDHIIRTEESLENLREYILHNPLRWDIDQLHPNNPSKW